MRPEFGVNTPLMRLNKVDLPAPFGPIQSKDFALAHCEAEIMYGEQPAETLADAVEFEARSFQHLLQAREAAIDEAHQAGRKEQHNGEEQRAGDHQLKIGKGRRREEITAQLLVEIGAERHARDGAPARPACR